MNSHINRSKTKIVLGNKVMVHAYKLNGWLYRCWDFPKVIVNDNKHLIVDLTNTKIISAEKNTMRSFVNWNTKKSFWVFPKNKWFNFRISKTTIGMKIYINLASPFIYEESAVKYYDLDLDFKYFTNGVWSEIDFKDFKENSKKYDYSPKLIKIIHQVEKEIWDLINKNYFNKFIEKKYLKEIYKLMETYRYGPKKID